MFELDQDLDEAHIIPMYIALAPRDPRDSAPRTADAVPYIDPVAPDELAEQLLNMSIPAQVIDGKLIGSPGWVIARTLGFDDGRALRWAPEENTTKGRLPSIGFEDVASQLANALNTHCHISDSPAVPSVKAHVGDVVLDLDRRAEAVIGRFQSIDGPLLAHTAGVNLWFAHRSEWSIVAGAADGAPEGDDLDVDMLLTWPNAQPTVAFERDGQYRRVSVAVHGTIVVTHEWGPLWDMVDPRIVAGEELTSLIDLGEENAADMVIDYFESATACARDFAPYFDLDEVALDRLDLVLDSPDMDDPLTAFARILGLPEEAAEVAEGWRSGASLEGAALVESKPLPQAMWNAVTTLPTESTWTARMTRLWLTRPMSYYVINGVEVAALAAGARMANQRGHRKTAISLGVLAAVTCADFFVPKKWRGQGPR